MSKTNKINQKKDKVVRSINNNVRSSVRKLNPILKGIVGKKLILLLEIYNFLKKELPKI